MLSVQLLTTSAHMKLAVSLESRCMCAACVYNTKCVTHTEVHKIFLDPFLTLDVCTCVHCVESVKQKWCMAPWQQASLPLLSVSYSLVKDIAVAFSGQINEARGSRMTKE